ncbi:MAG: hypothetical protein ABR585_09320 [Gemmatimonadaceae bacterium]
MINPRWIVALIVSTAGATSLNCQVPTASRTLAAGTDSLGRRSVGGCPGGNGIRISLMSGDGSAGVDRLIDDKQSLDTTIVFNVSQKSWTRTNLAAAITVGLADQSRGSYSICAGVTAMMPSATLTIRNARGRIRFIASLKSLTEALRLGPGATTPPPRRL